MQYVVYLVSVASILFVLHDIVVTVVSHKGAGPLTTFWTKLIWRLILWTRYRLHWKIPFQYAGPGFLIGIIGAWYLILYVSWVAILYVGHSAIEGSRDSVVDLMDILYYASSTFTTVGMGDYYPTGFPWTLVSTSGAFVMSVLLTLSVSYVLPVVSAATERRKMISGLNLIGESAQEILDNAWSSPHSGQLDSEVLGASDSFLTESHRSHVYPVLTYFQFEGSNSYLNIAIINLFDALLLQKVQPSREGNVGITKRDYLLRAIERYEKTLYGDLDWVKYECDHSDFFDFLKSHGVALSKSVYQDLDKFLKIRCSLLRLAHREGGLPLDDKLKLVLKNRIFDSKS